MYNFANEIWFSRDAVFPLEPGSHAVGPQWLNHYPPRVLTFNLDREFYWNNSQIQFIHLRSRYRGVELLSVYKIDRGPHGLTLRREGVK